MDKSNSQTIEQVFFDRMGISVENAMAAGADVVDEKVAQATESGINVDARISSLGQLLEKLTEPATVTALGELLERLPQLAQLARLADELPNALAALGDVIDDYQQQCSSDGIDFEKAIVNGLQAAAWLGTNVEQEQFQRIGKLLDSNILDPQSLNVINRAATSLNTAKQDICGPSAADRIGLFGLIGALRDPEVQRSVAFAVQFGKCFGKKLDEKNS